MDPPFRTNTFVPGFFDAILQPEHAGSPTGEGLIAPSAGPLDVTKEHLHVAVPAEAALVSGATNVHSGRVTEPSFADRRVGLAELSYDRNEAGGFVLNLLLLDDTAITADAVLESDFGAFSELVVEPLGHLVFVRVRPELLGLLLG